MPDKEAVSRNFSKSAPRYGHYAVLQNKIADSLLSSIPALDPRNILDLGCGVGYLAQKLAEMFPRADVVGIDIAPGMISEAGRGVSAPNLSFKIMDGEELQFNHHLFDLVVSSSSLQWMDLEKATVEVKKTLKPGGIFIFNAFGAKTLKELRAAGLPVNNLLSAEEYQKIIGSKLTEVYVSREEIDIDFKDKRILLLYLRKIGAHASNRKTENVFHFLKNMATAKATFEIISGFFLAP